MGTQKGRHVMARRTSSIGFFGRFGRSEDLRALDKALHAFDLHPAQVPDAVKLAALTLIKDARGEEPAPADYAEAAVLLAYCAQARDGFIVANGEAAAASIEQRIEAAVEAGEGFDARLILLALEAKIIHPAVKEAYRLESE